MCDYYLCASLILNHFFGKRNDNLYQIKYVTQRVTLYVLLCLIVEGMIQVISHHYYICIYAVTASNNWAWAFIYSD